MKGFFEKIISFIFIIAIITISVLLFCRRDVFIYDDTYGYFGVLVLCFLCNATVFAPAPSLAVSVTAAQTLHPIPVIILGAIGITLGEMVGYFSGKAGRNFSEKDWRITSWIDKHGTGAIFLLALLPLPLFDLAGVASGFFKIRWIKFTFACFLGKLLKITVYVYGSLLIGEQLKVYFNFIR